MQTLDQIEEQTKSDATKVLIYGAPFTGKTTLAGKLAEKYKLLWFDFEGGYKSLLKLPLEYKKNIQLISIHDTPSYPIAIESTLKILKGKVKLCNTHSKVMCPICQKEYNVEKTEARYAQLFTDLDLNNLPSNYIVVFDTLTQLANSAIAHITKNEEDTYKLQFDDYGALGKLMGVFLSFVQAAPYNCICISHMIEAEDEQGKIKIVPLAGTRNFSVNCAKYFNHVVFAEKKNSKHHFASSTGYANNILAGSATDVKLEDMRENASLFAIFGDPPTQEEKPNHGLITSDTIDTTNAKSKSAPNTPVTTRTADLLSKLKSKTN